MRRAFPALAGLVLLAVGCAAPGSSATAAQITDAQRFTLPSAADGAATSLDSLLASHKAVLVNFWATWCPPCREEIPDLVRLQSQFAERGFTVVGVDIGESVNKVNAFAQKFGINYPLLLDADSRAAESFGVVGIPTSLLVSSDGRVLGTFHAAGADLFAAVEKALQG